MPERLSEEARQEIAAAVKILKDDGYHIHRTYAKLLKTSEEETKTGDTEDTEGKPPPAKKNQEKQDVKPPKRGLGLWNRTEDNET